MACEPQSEERAGAIRHRRLRRIVACIAIAYLAYAAVFIYLSSFPLGGIRYYSLFDDMMISMRYARNLAHGAGLVWNSGGPRVEGFSNPLWVLIMACVHLLPISDIHTSLAVQILGAFLLAGTLLLTVRLVRLLSGGSSFAIIASAVLLALYLPLNTWGLLGTEVSLLAMLLTAALALTVANLKRGRTSLWPLVLLAVGILTRLDMVVGFVIVFAFTLKHVTRTEQRRYMAGGMLLLFLALAPQTILRFWYYGQPFPNTYYLKMTGYPALLRMTRGAYAFLRFTYFSHFLVVLVPLIAVQRRRSLGVALLAAVFAGQIVYSIYVGGDAWEEYGGSNRFVAVAMPSFFVLLGLCLRDIADSVRAWRSGSSSAFMSALKPVLVLAALFSMNSTSEVVRQVSNGGSILRETYLPTPFCSSAAVRQARVAKWLEEVTRPGARVAVVQAGVLPYFLDREVIDLLGKCDPVVAHQPMHQFRTGLSRLTAFYPGHLKWDYAWSVGRLQPDVIVGLWGPHAEEEARPFMEGRYRRVELEGRRIYLREGSQQICWSSVKQPGMQLTSLSSPLVLSDGSPLIAQ